MDDVWSVITVIGASMVKFAYSPLLAYEMGFSFTKALITTSFGGCLGVLVFHGTSDRLMARARRRRIQKDERRARDGKPPKRVFNRTRRGIVRVKRGQGLHGLALLTPAIISIPIGTIIAVKYFRNDRRMLPALLISVLLWALLLCSLWSLVV